MHQTPWGDFYFPDSKPSLPEILSGVSLRWDQKGCFESLACVLELQNSQKGPGSQQQSVLRRMPVGVSGPLVHRDGEGGICSH